MFKLVISDDEGKTTVVPLVRDEITIGRKEGNTIRLTERNVSRRHARLFKANGAFTIEDLSSYNGIKVNGRKIADPAPLKAGDQVTIGDYLLALQVDAAETMTEPTTPISQPEPEAPTTMLAAPSAEPVPPARLVMLSPPAPGAEFALGKPRVRFGRAEDLDAWVNHRSISREHAEIHRDGETYRIVDLGSANGLRVNGQDTREAMLKPGDVIEMGQVRFRFVGRGEAYVFDADRTIQMEAVPTSGSRAPIFAAAGIIVVAVAIAGVMALGGGSADDAQSMVTPLEEEPAAPTAAAPEVGPAAPYAADEEAFREALTKCQNALEGERFGEAIEFADQALALAAGNDDAQSCKTRASEGQVEEEKYEQALAHYRARRHDDAYAALAELAPDSPFLDREEAARIFDRYSADLVTQAGRLLDRNPERAAEIAQQVVDMGDRVPAERRAEASNVIRQASRRATVAVAPAARRQPRSTRVQRATEAPVREPVQERATTQLRDRELANACLQTRDYGRCFIDGLNGRPRTVFEYKTLIQAYRDRGNMPAALRFMEQFIERFPSDRETRNYQQFLLRYRGQ